MEDEYDYYFKIILLGCQAVGKTAIVQRFCNDCYEDDHKTTLGFDFLTKVLNYEGKKVQLQIWDTAGQERFRAVTKMYYQDVNGVVLVYDITSKSSMEKLQFWFDDLEMNGSRTEKRILVGNKQDLEKRREVQQFEGKKMASEQNIDWIECSAKTGANIATLFETLVGKLIAEQNANGELVESDMGNIFKREDVTEKSKKKKLKNGTDKTKSCC